MPGWGISPRQSMSKDIIGIGGGFDGGLPEIGCINCEGCRTSGEESSGQCCGCVNMEFRWGFDDIPDCEACDLQEEVPNWRTAANSYLNNFKRDTENGQEDEDVDDNDTTPVHQLYRRKDGTATMSTKPVSVCPTRKGDTVELKAPYKYPAFPKDPNNRWEGIQRGRWDSISRYWGNSSDLCQFWGVTALTTPDQTWVTDSTGSTIRVRADYQSAYN